MDKVTNVPTHVRVIDDTFCYDGLSNGDILKVLRFSPDMKDVSVIDNEGMVQYLVSWEFEGVL